MLKDLSLWDKKDSQIMTLSGGMKRRVLIAKALAHEPQILFLDEPTAGVDVELRKDMWEVVRALRASGVTIILTTHYIEEAEEMADRVGVINKGEIILVEEKAELMRKLGKKQLTLQLQKKLDAVPAALAAHQPRRLPPTAASSSTPTTRRASAPASRRCSTSCAPRHPLQGPAHDAKLAGGHLRRPGEAAMNLRAVRAIYLFEMARTGRTLLQSIVSPVISTSLYFVVFGAAIGSRITEIDGVTYGAFIVPGLIMLMLLTQSVANASFGIYFPRFTGTIYELLSAPVSSFEIVLGYVGAAATKSIILGLIILATAGLFVPLAIAHPFWMLVVPGADRGHLQPVRLHHRHLGRRLREAADHPAAGHHAADLPRRQLLFDQRAAAGLADGHAVQSGRLSDQRLPLELLRRSPTSSVGVSLGDDARVPRRRARDRVVDVPHRLPAEAVIWIVH